MSHNSGPGKYFTPHQNKSKQDQRNKNVGPKSIITEYVQKALKLNSITSNWFTKVIPWTLPMLNTNK